MDDSARAWSKTPPTNEAWLLYHLGELDDPPDAPTTEVVENDEVVVESLSWADFSKRIVNEPVSEAEE